VGRTIVVVVLIGECSAFGCRPKSHLADITRPRLNLYLGNEENIARVMVIVGDRPWSRSDCPLLAPEARATLNDVPLERLRGIQASDDFAYNRDCLLELSASVSSLPKPHAAARLRIWDSTTSWLLELPNAIAPRSFGLEYPGQAISKRGDRVALVWSQPNDDLDPSQIAFELLREGSDPGSGTVISDPEISGASIQLAIPTVAEPDSAWSGPALLRFLGTASVKPEMGPCPVDTCHVDLNFSVPSVPITIAN